MRLTKMIKTIILLSMLTCLFSVTACADNSERTETQDTEADTKEILFREYEWGTPLDDIIANELLTISDDRYLYKDGMFYIENGKVGGFKASIMFSGEDGKLVAGGYFLTEKHTNEIDYYNDYKSLVSKYTQVYGEPSYEGVEWKREQYKDTPEKWGMAVIHGDVVFTTEWEDDKGALIRASLRGDNYVADANVVYLCPGFEVEEDTDGI